MAKARKPKSHVHDLGKPPSLEVGQVKLTAGTDTPPGVHSFDTAKERLITEAKIDGSTTWKQDEGWSNRPLSSTEWVVREYRQRFEQHFIESPRRRGALSDLSKAILASMPKAIEHGFCDAKKVLAARTIGNILLALPDFPGIYKRKTK